MIKRMSDVLIQISSIKNLDMVKFYHLFDEGSMLPGLLAYYDSGKVINLCAADEGFSALLDKIAEVYSKEKEYGRIVLDADTERILNRSTDCAKEDYELLLQDFTEIPKPLFLHKAHLNILMLPIVKYIIEGIFNVNDLNVIWDVHNTDWYGKGILTAQVNSEKQHFPYRLVTLNDNSYKILINGLLRSENTLTVSVGFTAVGMKVSFDDSLYGYTGRLDVNTVGDEPKLIFAIERAGDTLYLSDNVLPQFAENKPCTACNISGEPKEFKGYKLPWETAVYTASHDLKRCCIFSASSVTSTISHGMCVSKLTDEDSPLSIGLFSYFLFESGMSSELHFLDMGYPQAALYKEHYAGKSYKLTKGAQDGNQT